jgi:ABC-2 type transport system ATP-binding protein
MYGMNGADIRQKISSLLQLVGMDRWGSTKINRYSKGMAQRIGLAQALMSDPDLLLLDEPTDGVDPVGKSEIKTVLQKIREQGKSILLNSHLLSEVELVADRVAILNKGKVLRTGSIDEFTTKGLRYEIEAAIGNERIEVPEDIGRVIALRANGMTVELNHVDHLNTIIDRLRLKRISIKSIQPTRISLEQSFLEALEEGDGLAI